MSARWAALAMAAAACLSSASPAAAAEAGVGSAATLAAVSAAAAPAPGARPRAGIEQHLGAQLPLEARFRASDGREVTLGDELTGDEPTLLVLAYNRCTMLCSLVLRSLAELVPALSLRPGEDYTLLAISIDPSDSVHEAARMQAALLDHAGIPGERQRWEFLVGERAAIDSVADALGFRYAWDETTAQYDHPAALFTLAPGGSVSGYFDGLHPDRSAIEAALRRPRGAAASVQQLILNCFRFDTTHGRYGGTITWLLRAGAASVGLGLIALLWRLGRAGRRPGVQP